jgi:hypothetical protein
MVQRTFIRVRRHLSVVPFSLPGYCPELAETLTTVPPGNRLHTEPPNQRLQISVEQP